jgi:uncharacterized membrane protein HdeD (DUF308 family)
VGAPTIGDGPRLTSSRTPGREPWLRIRRIVGLVLCAVGVLWIGQGIGVIGGSFMSGDAIWAVIGAIAVLFGTALLLGVRQTRRDQEVDDA